MKFTHVHHEIPGITWDEWVSSSGRYKIVTYREGEYYAYYTTETHDVRHVAPPPDVVECQGCGSAHCPGYHKAWATLESAQLACDEHNLNLPW